LENVYHEKKEMSMSWPLATEDPSPLYLAWKAADEKASRLRAEVAADATVTLGSKGEQLSPRLMQADREAMGAKEAYLADIARRGQHSRASQGEWGREWLSKMTADMSNKSALDATSGGTMVRPYFDALIRGLPQESAYVRSLIPTQPAEGDKVWYLRQTAATQNAAVTAAGALKPTSVYSVERVEAPIRVIATISEAHDRSLLADFSSLIPFLETQMGLGVALAVENEVINGTGGGGFDGLLANAGDSVTRAIGESNADCIYRGLTEIRSRFMVPDGIVLNVEDFQSIRLGKATGSGDYLSAGILQSDPDRLWGLRVVVSSLVPAGTGLVGSFATGAVYYEREGTRITFTEAGLNDDGDEMFTRNQLRWRAEARGQLALVRPDAFCKVLGLTEQIVIPAS
jgi:HK97 family phage major capsid protein